MVIIGCIGRQGCFAFIYKAAGLIKCNEHLLFGNSCTFLEYERGEAVPSIDAAKKIADALEVSLDNLVGEDLHNGFDKKTLKRFQELEHLEDVKKKILYDLIDIYIRDAKGRKTYAA